MIGAVVFDLDGTLTRPLLNFKLIRLEVGVEEDRLSLLDQIGSMPEDRRKRALEILERHEREAAHNAEVNRGAKELLEYVGGRGLRTGIITRNSDQSTFMVMEKLGIEVDRVITRDSGLPIKPDPRPLLALAKEWGLEPGRILMVGDYRFDVECGKKAGAVTVLVTNGREVKETGGPDHLVGFPDEVIGLLEDIKGQGV